MSPPWLGTLLTPLSGERLANETERLSDIIRCPVCQGSSVGDSPSEMAQYEAAGQGACSRFGFNDEQIIRYFESSYGEFIRLEPTCEGLNLIVWLAPLLGLGLGIFLVTRRLGSTTPPALDEAPSAGTLPEDEELARWVLRVREEVYGSAWRSPPGEERT